MSKLYSRSEGIKRGWMIVPAGIKTQPMKKLFVSEKGYSQYQRTGVVDGKYFKGHLI